MLSDACWQAFVRVEATAASVAALEKWTGWVESQLRKIIPKLEFARFVQVQPGAASCVSC